MSDTPVLNPDPADTHCSMCRAPLKPYGGRKGAECDGRIGCGSMYVGHGLRRRPSWATVAVMWLRWIGHRIYAPLSEGDVP